jgi:hypothetical protein
MNSFLLIQYLSLKYAKISLLLLLENYSSSPNILLHCNDFKSIPPISVRLGLYNIAFHQHLYHQYYYQQDQFNVVLVDKLLIIFKSSSYIKFIEYF